ncbi:Ig-like domain-containing protein, partial [Thiospirillum jenense]
MNRDTAWKVTEIYIATMGYAPDNEGLQYWINQININPQWTVETVAQSFFDQPLVQQKYPDTSDFGLLINALYTNIFNRQADEDGYSYWISELTSSSLTPNQMIVAMINGGWDNNDPQAASDMSRFGNQVEVALEFAEYQSNNGIVYSELSDADQIYIRQAGRAILANITESETTVEEAINSIPALLAPLEAMNSAPVANDDSATVTEGESIVIDVLENDSDPDGDALAITSITHGDHGTVTITDDGLEVCYTKEEDYSGSDQFEYTISDGKGGEATATVSVTVSENEATDDYS